MSNDIVLEVGLHDAVPKPTEDQIARRGPRRLVKLVPLPGNYSGPAIWTGPRFEDVDDQGKSYVARKCVVMLSKDPKPETVCITIPNEFYEKLLDVPVEW